MTSSTHRPSGRALDQMRAVAIEVDAVKHAEGSCLVKFGDTHVLCTASIYERVPPWMKNSGLGWVTAEYGMLLVVNIAIAFFCVFSVFNLANWPRMVKFT